MKNEEHYIRVKIPKSDLLQPILTNSNWWKYVVTMCSLILVGPLIPLKYRKSYPQSEQEYMYELLIAAGIILTYVCFEIWFGQMLPYFERKKGYYLKGKFEVTGKKERLGFLFLELKPGVGNKIKIERKLFHSLKIGDVILVERTPFGGIRKISKVSGFYNRVRRVSANLVN